MADGDYAINDKVIKEMMVNDIVEQEGLTEEEAREIVEESGYKVIQGMWEAYSKELGRISNG